ncbi:hypothetical protein BGZ46_007015 [Entomortierella lignicola]|nr:hypothetical protein BGZ46_007015 [Entomortierella lignicola]
MLTSTQPLAQKSLTSASVAHEYNALFSQHQQLQDEDQDNGSAQVQLESRQQFEPLHSHVNVNLSPDLALSHTTELTQGYAKIISKPVSTLPPTPPSAQLQKIQSKLDYYQPNGIDTPSSLDGFIPSPLLPILDTKDSSASLENSADKDGRRPEEEKFFVRLDLRKIGANISDPARSKKSSSRQQSKQKSTRNTKLDLSCSPTIQTTLNATSWLLSKTPSKEPITSDVSQISKSTFVHSVEIPIVDPKKRNGLSPLVGRKLRRQSVTLESKYTTSYNEYHGSRSDDDGDYIDNGSKAMKRQRSSKGSRNSNGNKRTRTLDQIATKKKRVEEDIKNQQQEETAGKSLSLERFVKDLIPSEDIVAITGDERALKARLIKSTEYISPLCRCLPDEWICNECYATKNPPPPAKSGIFKQLMDNLNRGNPKSFILPAEIRSFFKGVVAGSDGEYGEVTDNKPRVKRSSSASTNETMLRADEDTPQPRRRKRRDAIPIQLNDPGAPNDGSIEVIPDPEPILGKRSLWNTDTSGLLYKIPERIIKQSFIEKCQKLRKSRLDKLISMESNVMESSSWRFNLLVATVMANEHQASMLSSTESLNNNHVQSQEGVLRGEIQDAVLGHLMDPAEREEYLRFKAFQKYVREHGTEEALKQWLSYQEEEKKLIASQGLLTL